MARDFEDVSGFALSEDQERVLYAKQTECTFMWTNSAGEPVGVIMNYVAHDGSFWLTATRQRARVAAIERDPRVAIAISSRGTDIGVSQSVTHKGIATVHDDQATKGWFYPALAATVRPDSESEQQAFVEHLDSPSRVVIEVQPTKRISFDSEPMLRGSAAGMSRSEL
ncbi:MAG: pyridoxamine 5'-phosphate oxidase family protein [Microthrixaceae bacterium]